MFTTLAFIPLVLATLSVAAPTARQIPSGPCANFIGGFANATSFTLAALNVTLPNANTTGAPLVLGQAGAVDGAEFEALSTWASYQFNQWPSLTLTNGGLTGNMDPPNTQGTTVSGGAANSTEVGFETTSFEGHPSAPSPVFCGVADTDPAGGGTGFPQLALNGHTDLFSLCMTGPAGSPGSQNNVVYNASATNSAGFIFDTCYSVVLQMINLS